MKLTVVKSVSPQSPDAQWTRYVDIAFDYEEAVTEHGPVDLAYGRGVSRDSQAGLMLLPIGPVREDFVPTMQQAFNRADSMKPRVYEPDEPTASAFLLRHGYHRRAAQLFRLRSAAVDPIAVDGVMVVPARAAMAALETWCLHRPLDEPAGPDFFRRLDDTQFDGIIALRNGKVIGVIGLQIRGQTGLVTDLFVQFDERLSGVGSVLLGRALELAARSQLVDVFAAFVGDEEAPPKLLERAGFSVVRSFNEWLPS